MKDFIGHQRIIKNIIDLIKADKISHAHIIVGENGLGKSNIARFSAINILGKEDFKDYADIKQYRILNNKKSISVDQVRQIIEETNKKPYEGTRKVIILHDADKMTTQAQNAFLKTIEEPPRGVFIFLLCENVENILDTIISRCQVHKLRRLSDEEIIKFIKNRYQDIEEIKLKAVKAFCNGVPGRAERFMEDSIFIALRSDVMKIMLDIKEVKLQSFLNYEAVLTIYKEQWKETMLCFLSYIRDIMIYKETGNEELIVNLDKLEHIKHLAGTFSFNMLKEFVNIINETRINLESNVNSAMSYHIMLIKMYGI